jgi:hypothetical protein
VKERIIFDPKKWPTKGWEEDRGLEHHIRIHNPPEALWDKALPALGIRTLKSDHWQGWWIDLTPYDPSLKGWKLAGKGDLPNTIRTPKEIFAREGDVKLARFFAALTSFLDGTPSPLDMDASGIGGSPSDLDIP